MLKQKKKKKHERFDQVLTKRKNSHDDDRHVHELHDLHKT